MTIRDPSSMKKYPWGWRHSKGGIYEIIGFGIIESTMQPSVFYQAYPEGGPTFVRPCSEFFDGRFVPDV